MGNFMWLTIKSQHGHLKQEQLFDQMIPREDSSYCFIYLLLLLLNFNQTTEFFFIYYISWFTYISMSSVKAAVVSLSFTYATIQYAFIDK